MRRALRAVLPLALAASAGATYAVGLDRPRPRPAAAPVAAVAAVADTQPPGPPERQVGDLDIAFYTARVTRDPTGATDLAHLASLYLERARETGDPQDAIRAERAARRSLHNRSARNEQAAMVLASSLLSQHRFADALEVARTLSASNPEVASFRAMLGEIQLELGRYDEARETFRSLEANVEDLSVAPRFARWVEIEGRPQEARRILARALGDARRATHLPREQLAWFWLRLGDLDLRLGQADQAGREYREGLRAHPDDYRVLAALAHLAAVCNHWTEAIEYGERSISIALDPATLGILSDAYAALGDSTRAEEYARALDVAVLRQPGAYHRAWSLFFLDHRRHLARVYSKVRWELRSRHDVYGYDLLAWALYRRGRSAEAERAMTTALAQGTQDAQLFYHAGMIEHALGHDAAARQNLERAHRVNPYFHPMLPEGGRARCRAPGATRLMSAACWCWLDATCPQPHDTRGVSGAEYR